jgi:hypothetical protein
MCNLSSTSDKPRAAGGGQGSALQWLAPKGGQPEARAVWLSWKRDARIGLIHTMKGPDRGLTKGAD